jgi:mutator protein MutT
LDGARKQVEVAIAVVFEGAPAVPGNGRKVLVCRRKADTVLGGYWEFPGGKCEAGETLEGCACREVREETGLEVRVMRALAAIEHEYPHARVRLHPFICEHVGGELRPLQVAEAKWIAAEQVGEYRFPEANAGLVAEIARGFAQVMGEGK